MPELVLLDNDVALKVSCYAVVDETLAATTLDEPPAMLAVGKFVVRGRLERDKRIADSAGAQAAFERLLEAVTLLEPDQDDLAMAADLEHEAGRKGLELDGGESQLVSMLVRRSYRVLLTGDKRAIIALALLKLELGAARIACLEQLVSHLVETAGVDLLRSRVCANTEVDRALTSCFGCSQAHAEKADILAGLNSYIGHLEKSAPGVLLAGGDLTSMTT